MPRFADIRGQERAHDLLRRAAARDRLPHAYLFHGTRGVGKTSTAFALAQYLNCARPAPGDSCGTCPSCGKFSRLRHPDLHWIFPMAGSEGGKRLKGDSRSDHVRATLDERLAPGIHGLSYKASASIAIGRDEDSMVGSVGELRRQAGFAPVEARIKVFVITEAERMTAEAANSLLKVLEEPPPGNLLILTTHRPTGLLDTIVSRCQAVRFRDLLEEEIAALLVERLTEAAGAEGAPGRGRRKAAAAAPPQPRAAGLAAALARGSLTHAASLLEEDVVAGRDVALRHLELRPGDPGLYEGIEELVALRDRAAVARLLDFGVLWAQDLLRAATGSAVPLSNRDREAAVRAEAAGIAVAAIRRRVRALEEARRAMEGNVYLPLVLHRLALELAGDDHPMRLRPA